jgi:hypothetical protein
MPYIDSEVENGVCPGCDARLASPVAAPRNAPAPHRVPGRTVALLVGLFLGCLAGLAAGWTAMRLGMVLPGAGVEQAAALRADKERAEEQARQSEVVHRKSEVRYTKVRKALVIANQQADAARKQQADAEQRLKDALRQLTEEQHRRAALEKVLAAERKARLKPTLSFVRNWQLLGPFPTAPGQAHDAVFPPEHEPIQLHKAHNGHGGLVRWRPYHSDKDLIDLGDFFKYHDAGVAYAVSWVHSDGDQHVTLGIGSDDGVVVWVNREKVDDAREARPAVPGRDMVKAHLREGWNEILAKVDNISDGWALYLEFRTTDGGQPLKMYSTTEPPSAEPQ